ncbi:MAG: hypothetical protein GDA50_04150 [Alphaproteobacteria bacterium GM202ARS2]|nr:hypothetical protein [Alphaproteobacteria bacterium GM202ARS2]
MPGMPLWPDEHEKLLRGSKREGLRRRDLNRAILRRAGQRFVAKPPRRRKRAVKNADALQVGFT